YIGPMHDIENCCSFLYICLWLFKYTKTSAVFFYFILTLSLEMSDDPYKKDWNDVKVYAPENGLYHQPETSQLMLFEKKVKYGKGR
ncbi:MAG: hypothetical protein SOY06_09255, partial [Prevotella sp.]|nr:hypothetical protein [Prevotella sp.]